MLGEEVPRGPALDLIYNGRECVQEGGRGLPAKSAGVAFRPDLTVNGGMESRESS